MICINEYFVVRMYQSARVTGFAHSCCRHRGSRSGAVQMQNCQASHAAGAVPALGFMAIGRPTQAQHVWRDTDTAPWPD